MGIIVMEKIPGHDWDHYLNQQPSLSKREQKKQLGRIVQAIKHIWKIEVDQNGKPGPFGGHEPVGGVFELQYIEESFQSYHDLERWVNDLLAKQHEWDHRWRHKKPRTI